VSFAAGYNTACGFCGHGIRGVCSGFFVVPLDALLQKEGNRGVGAGSAIAIQNMFENLSMLALVSAYSAAVFLRTPVNEIAVAVGLFIALSMAILTVTSGPKMRPLG